MLHVWRSETPWSFSLGINVGESAACADNRINKVRNLLKEDRINASRFVGGRGHRKKRQNKGDLQMQHNNALFFYHTLFPHISIDHSASVK